MTDAEYKAEMVRMLLDVPKAFRGFIEQNAWDHGHSSGYEEVINIASSLIADLVGPIKDFEKEIRQQY
jgi:hypothetical protein